MLPVMFTTWKQEDTDPTQLRKSQAEPWITSSGFGGLMDQSASTRVLLGLGRIYISNSENEPNWNLTFINWLAIYQSGYTVVLTGWTNLSLNAIGLDSVSFFRLMGCTCT